MVLSRLQVQSVRQWSSFSRLVGLFTISLAVYADVAAAQQVPIPFASTHHLHSTPNFDFTSPYPHIFTSLRYLLEQWPNTYIPNGHSIVPCTIPAFTTLYHGRRDGKLPSSPEWFAFDSEMSYGIMGSYRDSHLLTYQNIKPVQCLYFDGMSAALMGSGPLDSQMVVVCGNTTCAAPGEPWRGIFDEYSRATALCEWIRTNEIGGLGWGVEGIVRMNAGFEMIWCDFESPSVRLVERVNVSAPLLPEGFRDDEAKGKMDVWEEQLPDFEAVEMLASRTYPPLSAVSPSSTDSDQDTPTGEPDMPPPPNWRSKAELEPFLQSQSFEWYRSAAWHVGSSKSGPGRGEGRVKINACGFLSYYDSMLKGFAANVAETERLRLNLTVDGSWNRTAAAVGKDGNLTLALKQLSTRRLQHNLSQITEVEGNMMNDAVLQAIRTLNTSASQCTGIDWVQKAVDVTSRFSKPLTQVLDRLSHPPAGTSNATIVRDYIASLRSKSHAMLMPYLKYPLTKTSLPDIQTRCSTHETSALYDLRGERPILPTEQTLLTTFETILSTICNATLSLAFDMEETWQTFYQPAHSMPSADVVPHIPASILNALVSHHVSSISLLRAWLGWFPDTMGCDAVCAVDEFCFIPIWPLLFLEQRDGFGRRPPPPPDNDGKDGKRPPPPGRGGDRGPPRRRGPRRGSPWGDLEKELWTPRCMKTLD